MKICEPYSVKIWCGLKVGYTGPVFTIDNVKEICQDFCNSVKLGITVTPTDFIYVDGNEPGFVIGLINYPRFPKGSEEILEYATKLAKILMVKLQQQRATIEAPDRMIMLEYTDIDKESYEIF